MQPELVAVIVAAIVAAVAAVASAIIAAIVGLRGARDQKHLEALSLQYAARSELYEAVAANATHVAAAALEHSRLSEQLSKLTHGEYTLESLLGQDASWLETPAEQLKELAIKHGTALVAIFPQIQDAGKRRARHIEEGHTLLARARVHAGPDVAQEIARVEQEILRPKMFAGTLHHEWERLSSQIHSRIDALHEDLDDLRRLTTGRARPPMAKLSGPAKLLWRGVAVAFSGAATLVFWGSTSFLASASWGGFEVSLRAVGVVLIAVAAVTCLLAGSWAAWAGRISPTTHGRGSP